MSAFPIVVFCGPTITPDQVRAVLPGANVIVTDGDLFEDRTRVVHVFIDGRKVEAEQPAPAGGRGRGRGGN